MKSRRPNQPQVIRSVVAEKPSCHFVSRKSSYEEAATSQPNIDLASSLVAPMVFLPREHSGWKSQAHGDAAHACMHACMHACSHAMRHDARRIVSKGYHDFPMQIAKAAQPAKITVGNNTVDWEVELACASRETDNISLGRPLRRTIKQSTRRDNEHQPHNCHIRYVPSTYVRKVQRASIGQSVQRVSAFRLRGNTLLVHFSRLSRIKYLFQIDQILSESIEWSSSLLRLAAL